MIDDVENNEGLITPRATIKETAEFFLGGVHVRSGKYTHKNVTKMLYIYLQYYVAHAPDPSLSSGIRVHVTT